jgi:hypothetical protein
MTRLTPEREAEIREFAEAMEARMTLDLLSEIDALREERDQLKRQVGHRELPNF